MDKVLSECTQGECMYCSSRCKNCIHRHECDTPCFKTEQITFGCQRYEAQIHVIQKLAAKEKHVYDR